MLFKIAGFMIGWGVILVLSGGFTFLAALIHLAIQKATE